MLDNFRAISVTWDHSTNTIYNNIRTASEDANGRKLVVQVVNGHQLEDLTSVDLRLYWEFDEHKGFDDFELIDEDNGIYEIHFSTDMVSHVGAHKTWLHLVDAEGTVTSEPFTVTVFEGVDADTIQDSNEFSALSNALVAISDLETNYAPRLNSVENNKADKATVNSEVSRLDQKDADLTAQLAQKVGKGEVSVSDINKNLGKFDQSYMSDELLQQMAGNTPINAVPANFSITQNKFAERAVTPEKTSFIEKSTNLFNRKDITVGMKIEPSSGNLLADPRYDVSNFIPVLPDTTYTLANFARKAFYTIDHVFIISDTAVGTITTPANAFYVKLQCDTAQLLTGQMNLGGNLLPYEDYFIKLKDSISATPPDLGVSNDKLANQSVSIEKTDFILKSSNLFNKKAAIEGKRIAPVDGSLSDDPTFYVSEPIPISEQTVYTLSSLPTFGRKAFYRKDGSFISTDTTQGTFTSPPDSYFIRVQLHHTQLDGMQLNVGGTLLPYEDYFLSIKGLVLDDEIGDEVEKLESFKLEDKYIIDGVTDGVYTSPEIPQHSKHLSLVTAEDIYAMFDELVTNYPTYVSRTLLGRDSSDTHDIYRYDFKPSEVPTVGLGEKNAKMIILGGVHGQEKIPSLVIYHVMKQICENWKTEPVLDTLRWNVHLIIVPVVNPYGYSISDKVNANGVNLARNFPTDWSASESNPGPYPLSEVETQYVDNIMNENKEDTVFFTSYHNFIAGETNSNVFIWQAAGTRLQLHIAKKLISKLSRKWKKQYTWLPQDETTYFGYADNSIPLGSEGRHANSYGIHGSTFETSREFRLEHTPIRDGAIPLTLGTETFVNFLLLGLVHGVDYRNNKT